MLALAGFTFNVLLLQDPSKLTESWVCCCGILCVVHLQVHQAVTGLLHVRFL